MNNTASTISAFTWLFTSSALTKVVTLAGQIVLGWLLLPDEFGVYAVAVSVAAITAVLRNGGTQQVLIRGGADYESQAGLFFKFALAFNLIAMLVLMLLSIPYFHANPAIGAMLIAIAVSIPLGTPAVVFKAKLTIDRRFQVLAKIGLLSAVIWQGGVVLGALSGLGALSYALPLIAVALYENFAGWNYERRLPHLSRRESWSNYLTIFRQTRWLMLSNAVISLASTGIYFVVAWLTDEHTVGLYFFAYQLVFSFSVPISTTISAALPMSLIRLAADQPRQTDAYLRALRTILVTGVPLSAVFGLALPTVVHVVWQGKWDVAGEVSQLLCACIPAWFAIAVVTAMLEARGMWRLHFAMMSMYGFGGIAATAIGALLGDLRSVAIAVVIFYNCLAVLLLLGLSRILNTPLRRTIECAGTAPALGVLALILGMQLTRLLAAHENSLGSQFVKLSIFALVCGIGNWLVFRSVWSQLLASMFGRMGRFLPLFRGASN